MRPEEITIGMDPEFFYENECGVVPAFFALGGDVDIALPHGTAYCDGAAIEMTVEHDTNPVLMAMKLGQNIRALEAHVGNLSVRSNGYVSKAYIDQLPVEFGKRASLQILGCDADTRVYPWAEDIRRPDPKTYEYRTLGGHIHIGVGKQAIRNLTFVNYTVAMCDALMGTAGTYLCDDQESRDRKKLYGKSGTIRLKTYGAIEYRPLPSKALTSRYDLAVTMFTLAQKIGAFIADVIAAEGTETLYELVGGHRMMQAVSAAIDEHDVGACRQLQIDAAARFDAHRSSPLFAAHVGLLQAMHLLPYTMEWE